MASKVHMVLPDLHIPFQDPWLVDQFILQAKDLKPAMIHIIGDLVDCYLLSRFDKNPARKDSFQDEMDSGIEVLGRIREASPQAKIHYSEGNHEARVTKLLWGQCRAFAGLRGLTIPELLQLKKMKIAWHPWREPYSIGSLWFTHGDIIRKHAGCTARAVSDRSGRSVIVGHSHRQGCVPRTLWDDQYIAWECGHMCDVGKMEYLSNPDWQAGWLIIDYLAADLWDINPVRRILYQDNYYLLHKGEKL